MLLNPSVSIILPSYNHAHFLRSSLESVLAQTYSDWEVIVVDDGSTDNTREVMQGYTDKRIRYIYQKNRGLSGARNSGLREARGQYIALLDADDVFLPNKLEVQVRWLEHYPDFDWVASGWNLIDEKGQILDTYLPGRNPPDLSITSWMQSCHICPIAMLMKREWTQQVGGFDETLRQVEDWDYWLRLVLAGCKMGWVNEVLCSYRLSLGQMTRNATVQKQSSIQMMDKHFGQPGLPQELVDQRNEIYTHLLLLSAGREFCVRQIEGAQASLKKAAEYSPRLTQTWDEKDIKALLSGADQIDGLQDRRETWLNYRKYILENLPKEAYALRKKSWQIYGEAIERQFYEDYRKKNWRQVLKLVMAVAFHRPEILYNRGFWSITLKSICSVFNSHKAVSPSHKGQ